MKEMLLSEHEKSSRQHYQILLLSWAGWIFDFYNLILYTFLLIPIKKEFGFSNVQLSYVLGTSLAATAVGGATFGFVADSIGRRPAYSVYSLIMAAGLVMITLLWNTIMDYPYVILTFMFLVGFGTGIFAGFVPLFSELFPTAIRNAAMGSAFNLARGVQFFTPVIIWKFPGETNVGAVPPWRDPPVGLFGMVPTWRDNPYNMGNDMPCYL